MGLVVGEAGEMGEMGEVGEVGEETLEVGAGKTWQIRPLKVVDGE